MNFVKFLRIPVLQNTSGRLLLKHNNRVWMTSQSIYITSFFHSLKTFYKSQVSVFPYEFFFLFYTSRFPLKLSYRFAAITHFSTISNISIQRCLLLSTAQIFLEATVHESFEKMASKFFESFSGFLKKLVYSSYSV